MSLTSYTLDRFEGEYAVFLRRPEETEELILHCRTFSEKLHEGDIVTIQCADGQYNVERLVEETATQQDRIKQMIEALRKKHK